MAHHLLPNIELGWLDQLTHCFLIRDPRKCWHRFWSSFREPTIRDTGLLQQLCILEMVRARDGIVPPVLDARDVLETPRAYFAGAAKWWESTSDRKCCRGHPVDATRMVSGPSTGMTKSNKRLRLAPIGRSRNQFPIRFGILLDECEKLYAELRQYRIQVSTGK